MAPIPYHVRVKDPRSTADETANEPDGQYNLASIVWDTATGKIGGPDSLMQAVWLNTNTRSIGAHGFTDEEEEEG